MSIPVRVLLIGKGMSGASPLHEHLARKKCSVQWAKSIDHGLELVKGECFDVVLGPISVDASRRSEIVASLLNSSSHLFFSLTVEDGCWWLPVVKNGKHCAGSPAVRCRDFLLALDQLLLERQSAQRIAENLARRCSEVAST